MCERVGLGFHDTENMTVGFCLDYINESIEQQKPKEDKPRTAKQSDFDSF